MIQVVVLGLLKELEKVPCLECIQPGSNEVVYNPLLGLDMQLPRFSMSFGSRKVLQQDGPFH